jgi:hypothetical protein
MKTDGPKSCSEASRCNHPRDAQTYKYETVYGLVMFRDYFECGACGAQYSLEYRKWEQPSARSTTTTPTVSPFP